MIRFKDNIFEDYSIDPVTAVITDINGKVKHVYFHGERPVVKIHGFVMPVHQVQAHTAYGYRKGNIVHHNDENILNNALSNLDYDHDQAWHIAHHHPEKHISEETRKEVGARFRGRTSAFKGRTHTEEAKEKNRISHTGKKCSDETKEKMRISHTGKEYSNETRAKHSLKTKGNRWWHNDDGETRFCKECPDGWEQGRLKRKK